MKLARIRMTRYIAAALLGAVWITGCGASHRAPLIAFGSAGNLYVVSSQGGQARELVGAIWTGADYTWTPRGDRIVVSVEVGQGGDLDDIFAVSLDGRRTRLTRGGNSANLSLSPDGKLLAFEWTSNAVNGVDRIMVANADGSRIHRLTHASLTGVPNWSPTDLQLTVDTITNGIYLIDVAGSHIRRIPFSNPGDFPVWSPDGRRIAFSKSTALPGGTSREDVVIAGADGRTVRRLLHGNRYYSGSPAWSPDGKLIALSVDDTQCKSRQGECQAIFVARPNGTGLRRLTPYSTICEEPSWSPDGRQIAYVASRTPELQSKGEGSIYVMNADGSDRHRILVNPQADDIEPLVWQPAS